MTVFLISRSGIHYIPMTHGMTIGDLAQYLNGEEQLLYR
ncbi:exo-beta-N-acetylmuramidase NamZ domain-containing protein [Dyadobacter pollutisoli]|uniref:DUF1343 domain-containing protein n=1 Tax=Dyadobacter pollutisoli TaxID=2910158 RepID=A0A9E8SN63_9BACT|nr:exo-beta-N-acetylmuramidase NamZ domain-containing protein [Dyadobacter pollutisoli]WAC14928.1 DUF1343 domain-containing protein [Dyadobacter pollutisoli]